MIIYLVVFIKKLRYLSFPDMPIENRDKKKARNTCLGEIRLFSDTKLFDELTVFYNIFFLEVIEQSSSLTYQHYQSPTGRVIFFILSQMFCQIINSCRHDRDLGFY